MTIRESSVIKAAAFMLLSSLISASVILFVLQFDKYRKQRSARALSNYELNCEVLPNGPEIFGRDRYVNMKIDFNKLA